MEFSLLLLVAIVTFASIEAKVPGYIHVCKQNDPKFSKCIENSLNSMVVQLKEGIPELGVVKIDPLSMDKLVFNLGPEITAEGTNLKLTGGRNTQIKNMVANPKTDTYTFDIIIPDAGARGNYEINATIASIPLNGKGPIIMTAKSILGKVKLQGKKVPSNGRTKYYFPSMELKSEIVDYEVKLLGQFFKGAPQFDEAINQVLNEQKDELLKHVIPSVEKTLINQALDSANKIIKSHTWEELCPES